MIRIERSPALLTAVVFLALLFALAAKSVADADLWGNIRFGQLVLASRSPFVPDPYSFTSDRAWENHEWLGEVLMAATYELGGVPGLLLLSCGAACLILLVTAYTLLRSGVGEPVTAGLLAVMFLGLGGQLSVIRPQLFSAVLFVILLVILRSAERNRPLRLFWVAPLFAAWANLHGGWIVGLGVLGLWAVLAAARSRIPLWWGGFAPLLAVVGSALNPYGWRLWVFLWQTVGLGRADIEDWQPIFARPPRLVAWCLTAAVVGIAWRRRTAESVHLFVPAAILGLLALKVVRLDVSFAVAAVIMLGPLLAGLGSERFRLSRRPSRSDLAVVGLLMAVGLSVASFFAYRTASCLPIEGEREVMPEPEAVLFVQRNHLGGKIVPWYNYAHYAIWHLAPALKFSYDGRRETVYSEKIREAHLRFYRGEAPTYPRELGADYVWLPKGLPAVASLPDEGWVPVFQGSRSVILARQPGAYESVGRFSGPRCFPGP